MRKYLVTGVALLALAVAGCGGANVANTPQAKEAEALAKSCITKGSKAAVVKCLAPPGHAPELKRCAVTGVTHNFYNQAKLVTALGKCVVKFR